MIPNALSPREKLELDKLRQDFLSAADVTGVRGSLLSAIAWRESAFGLALRDGCGDWTMRQASRYGPPRYRSPAELLLLVVDEPQIGWAWPRDRDGVALPGPMCLPMDRRGFGRGIMQLDWCAHHKELEHMAWRNPAMNILFGTQEYKKKLDWLSSRPHVWSGSDLEHCAIASYNCGEHCAYANILDGRDPDSCTSGHDYARWVRAAEVVILKEWK